MVFDYAVVGGGWTFVLKERKKSEFGKNVH